MALRSGVKGFSSEIGFKVNCFVRIVWLVKENFGITSTSIFTGTKIAPTVNISSIKYFDSSIATVFNAFAGEPARAGF